MEGTTLLRATTTDGGGDGIVEMIMLKKKNYISLSKWFNTKCIDQFSSIRILKDYGPETGSGRRYTDWIVEIHDWHIFAKHISSLLHAIPYHILSNEICLEITERQFFQLKEKHIITCFGKLGWDKTGNHRILHASGILSLPIYAESLSIIQSLFEAYEGIQHQRMAIHIEPL